MGIQSKATIQPATGQTELECCEENQEVKDRKTARERKWLEG